VLGHSDYHYRHEPVLFGYKASQGRRGRGSAGWYGGNDCSSVFEIPRPNDFVASVNFAHGLGSMPGGLALDNFAG